MRGTSCDHAPYVYAARITPAYAGNIYIEDKPLLFQRDHPRVCGEHQIEVIDEIQTWGSPPRMRGT